MQGFTFGRSEPADVEGAREARKLCFTGSTRSRTCQVTMHWASHVPRPKPGPDCQELCKYVGISKRKRSEVWRQDFRKLNRAAAKSGVRHWRRLDLFSGASPCSFPHSHVRYSSGLGTWQYCVLVRQRESLVAHGERGAPQVVKKWLRGVFRIACLNTQCMVDVEPT